METRSLKSKWQPEPDWLLLLPTELPNRTEGGVIIPETISKKGNAGIVVRVPDNGRYDDLKGKEVFFPPNDEYVVTDSDTDETFIIVRADHLIMSRVPTPKKEFFRVSQGRSTDSEPEPEVATLQRNTANGESKIL